MAVFIVTEVFMPRKAKRPCRHPGCPEITEGNYCEKHKSMHPDRPSASRRGYSSKWRRVRAAYLRKHPMCVKCMAEGRYVEATVVDHIKAHRNNPVLMWDENNFQSLCKSCHDKKTGNEDSNPEYVY